MLSRGSYPLTSMQEIILLQQKYSLDKSVSNINIVVHFEGEVQDDYMIQAQSLALLRNPSSSLQIHSEGKTGYVQVFGNTMPEPVEIVDFSEASEKDLESYLKKEGQKAFGNKCLDVPLYKAKYILKPGGKRAMYFVVNHMIFDAFSLMFMAEDAFDIYEALVAGKPLPKRLGSPIPLFEKERDYLNSEAYADDLAFWDEVLKDEPLYSSLHPAGSKDYNKGKRTGKYHLSLKNKSETWIGKIPGDLVKKAQDFAIEHQVTVQSLFMLPLRNFHSRANRYAEDVLFINPLAIRSTRLEKESGGMRVSSIFLRFRFGNDLSFLEAAKELTRNYNAYFRHAKCPFMSVFTRTKKRFGASMREGYASTGVTFQPYALKKRENLPIRLEYISNGQSAQPLYATFMRMDHSDDLYGIYEHMLKVYPTPELIEELHQHLIDSLGYALDHPDVTLRELMQKF